MTVKPKTNVTKMEVKQRKASLGIESDSLNVDVVPKIPTQNIDSEDNSNNFLVDLMYMFSGVYNISISIPTWKRIIWNVYPAISQMYTFFTLILVWSSRLIEPPKNQLKPSLILRLSQTSLFLMNLSAFYSFYVSRKSGISIQRISRQIIKFAFILGTIFTILVTAVYIANVVITKPFSGGGIYLVHYIAFLVFNVPVFSFQTVVIGLHVWQYYQLVVTAFNELEAMEEKNDAKMFHIRLVEARDECFLYFKKYIALPFLPFFCFSAALVVLNVIVIYLPQVDDTISPEVKTANLMLEILYLIFSSK